MTKTGPAECFFTPSWRRPRRGNDVVPPAAADSPSSSSSSDPPFWRSSKGNNYPCLVCGKPPPPPPTPARAAAGEESHKRCGRCRSAVYCSSRCQREDYAEGRHKSSCVAIGKLWEEKSDLEKYFWEDKSGSSTNPFDDAVYDYPTAGRFWHDRPGSEPERRTTKYCIVMLQLVQLLGRGESWRVSRVQQGRTQQKQRNGMQQQSGDCSKRRGPGNPLSRELAIDIAYQLLHLDRTDMRVRLLIPSLLLEGGYYQEAYDFLRHWLKADTSLVIMDMALMGGPMEEEGGEESKVAVAIPGGADIVESPQVWMDGEMVYPSVGMVFELAFLKCHLLCALRNGRFRRDDGSYEAFGAEERSSTEPISIAKKCIAAGEDELEMQVRLLLSVVHKWNPHLLSNLSGPYDVETGALSCTNATATNGASTPATPPALSTLLNKHPPGFELQYKMGNPGGNSVDEAVSIWQRDMILWHVVDPAAMKFLSEFCSNLEENLVDTGCLNGGASCQTIQGNDISGGGNEDNQENISKRREAEELVARLQREDPDRTMDQIMMHPEMAQLMIKHLHTG